MAYDIEIWKLTKAELKDVLVNGDVYSEAEVEKAIRNSFDLSDEQVLDLLDERRECLKDPWRVLSDERLESFLS